VVADSFLIHWRVNQRLSALAAQTLYLDRIVKYGRRHVGWVSGVAVVDGGRAVRLTVTRTADIEIEDRMKLSLGNLR
jgi:hypothetical protein